MKKVLIDNSIISYYLQKHPKTVENYINNKGYVYISRISVIQMLSSLKLRNDDIMLKKFLSFIKQHKILDTSASSAEISANILSEQSKKGGNIGNFNIIIAGIAIANNLVLITKNYKEYENIENLSLEDWTIDIEH